MFGIIRLLFTISALVFLSACASTVVQKADLAQSASETFATTKKPRILVMGDSLLAWNKRTNRAVGTQISRILDEPVIDRSVVGATALGTQPLGIVFQNSVLNQYEAGNWDWVVMNGGGNDLWLGCGCSKCEATLNSLISSDGRYGKIPSMVTTISASQSRIIYLGYMRTPGKISPIEHCGEIGARFEKRVAALAARNPNLHFISLADLVPNGDLSYHAVDRIHPSYKASEEIGAIVARKIRQEDLALN